MINEGIELTTSINGKTDENSSLSHSSNEEEEEEDIISPPSTNNPQPTSSSASSSSSKWSKLMNQLSHSFSSHQLGFKDGRWDEMVDDEMTFILSWKLEEELLIHLSLSLYSFISSTAHGTKENHHEFWSIDIKRWILIQICALISIFSYLFYFSFFFNFLGTDERIRKKRIGLEMTKKLGLRFMKRRFWYFNHILVFFNSVLKMFMFCLILRDCERWEKTPKNTKLWKIKMFFFNFLK